MSTSDKNSETESTEGAEESEKAEGVEEAAGEVVEKAAEGEKEAEEDIVEERVYTVPLSRAWVSPRKERAPRATRILKAFIKRHMKPESIILSKEVNEQIWRRGIEKPPRNIRVRAVKDRDGKVSVRIAEAD